MKASKLLTVLVIVAVFAIGVTACNDKKEENSTTQATVDTLTTAELQSIQSATDQQQTVGETIPTPNDTASVNNLLGSWTDIYTPSNFAKITKTSKGYQYEDNAGKYQGTFKNGIITLKVDAKNNAKVYFDAKTGHMFMEYQGYPYEFKKK